MRNGAPSRDVVSRSLHPQLRRAAFGLCRGASERVPLTVRAEAPDHPQHVADATPARGRNDARSGSGPLLFLPGIRTSRHVWSYTTARKARRPAVLFVLPRSWRRLTSRSRTFTCTSQHPTTHALRHEGNGLPAADSLSTVRQLYGPPSRCPIDDSAASRIPEARMHFIPWPGAGRGLSGGANKAPPDRPQSLLPAPATPAPAK